MDGANKRQASLTGLIVFILLVMMLPLSGSGQERETEEIVVRLEIPRLIQKDIFVLYDGADIYMSLPELFSLLEINLETDYLHGIFSGDYLYAGNNYEINLPGRKAKCFDKEIAVDSTQFIATEYDLFLKLNAFDTIFGLKMFFSFSDLRIYMPLEDDFPIYKRLKRQKEHQKLKETRVALKDVYDIPEKKQYIGGGVADWMFSTSPVGGGDNYFSLALGGMLLGGDFAISGTGSSQNGLESDNIRYKWHYVFNENRYITQAEFGDINTASHLSRGLKGLMVTNQPEIRRKYFQTISLSDRIGPGWEVELFVNNKLVDFTKTDDNGEYNFLVDTEYGRTKIELKMYGPNGEIQTDERLMTVPFNLIPKKAFEYTLAGGRQESYGITKKYAQVNGYYGLFSRLTVGLSSDIPVGNNDEEKPTTALEVTYQPLENLMLNSSYAPNYAAQFDMSLRNISVASVTANYTKYYENQFRNRLGQLNGYTFTISSPIRLGRQYMNLRLRYTMDNYRTYKTQNTNFGFKIQAFRTHLNYIGNFRKSTFSTRIENSSTSKIILSTAILRYIKPQVAISYDHNVDAISKIGIYLHKRILRHGQLSLSLEDNRAFHSKTVMLTFNLATDFADFTSRAVRSGGSIAFNQMQKGSVRYNQNMKSFRFVRRNGIGVGAAVIWPFLDENYNGVFDTGESLLPELKARIGGASSDRKRKDNYAFYDNLRPYDDYLVEIDRYSLDNPMLTPAHENYRVSLTPNTVTEINIPIVTAGEIAGKVDRKIPDGSVGVGGIKLIIVNEITGKEAELITFNSGEFFHIGLVPGMYRAYIDPDQLERYGYNSKPAYSRFQIKTISGGDYVGNINFMIEPKE